MSISETMRNIENLLRKYERTYAYATAPMLVKEQVRKTPLTVEQHDYIYSHIADTTEPVYKMASRYGVSATVLFTIRKRQHKHYDPVRSEAWRKEAV
jgi:hypothetical protein